MKSVNIVEDIPGLPGRGPSLGSDSGAQVPVGLRVDGARVWLVVTDQLWHWGVRLRGCEEAGELVALELVDFGIILRDCGSGGAGHCGGGDRKRCSVWHML